MGNTKINSSRRNFLRAAPVAATAGFTLTRASLFASSAVAQAAGAPAPTFKLFKAGEIASDIDALNANPGNDNLVQTATLTVVLTTEKTKSGAEFEYHEHRDHIFQILDGATVYELGGTPKGAHSMGPGEWHAPESEGHETVALNKGDMLLIARGTPHRRITATSVTFSLISSQGN